MKTNNSRPWLVALAALTLSLPALAQTAAPTDENAKPAVAAAAAATAKATLGAKQKVAGIITQRDPDGFILRQASGGDMVVKLTNSTEVREKKSNPFRGAHKYAVTELVRNLGVEVEGRGDSTGALVADKIRFTPNNLQMAQMVETRVTPVEGRMQTAETRLAASEQNAQRLSGQIEELNMVTTAVKTSAKNAQQTADNAVAGISTTNERITSIDDYDAVKSTVVRFKVGSAVLSEEAIAALAEISQQAKQEKGFVIEVAGFASSEGGQALNRRLSDQRAQAVMRYLAEEQDIPLRRIVTPMGYGASHPAADNSTRDGRQQNRRVEVKLLVSRGLKMTASAAQPVAPGQAPEQPKPNE